MKQVIHVLHCDFEIIETQLKWKRCLSIEAFAFRTVALRRHTNKNTVANFRRQDESGVMDPYAKPNERKVGVRRPKISHLARAADTRTRKDREAEKQAVAAERRAIKKSARRYLKQQLFADLENAD